MEFARQRTNEWEEVGKYSWILSQDYSEASQMIPIVEEARVYF